ncbi:hypothetical protein [Pseudohoeflea coraliihabitans]|uniref:Uncharacterized protein n=1 Tax=Pseudohoeflea coraliihabitans TaxID=2860393 RepID=A0ABS6WLP9_9HYPH|nr:hypothetical protein [Pseudohoeflea sp. DP4N28-3]MBW3096868.1 hypothetical protein [Pseudohoeflea sp. DP4N28-3]
MKLIKSPSLMNNCQERLNPKQSGDSFAGVGARAHLHRCAFLKPLFSKRKAEHGCGSMLPLAGQPAGNTG